MAVDGDDAGCVPGSGSTRSGMVAAAAAETADLEMGGSWRMARGMGSLPSSMDPSLTMGRDFGSRENFSRASAQRAARGQTCLHSLRMVTVRWSIMGPSRAMLASGQTVACVSENG